MTASHALRTEAGTSCPLSLARVLAPLGLARYPNKIVYDVLLFRTMAAVMSEPGTPTLDQLTVFLAIVEAGGFAAAARRLNRANSVVSYAIANLEAICQEYLKDIHRLEVVDVLEHPGRAMAEGVLVTPSLAKVSPLPVANVIGNLSDKAKVLLALGLAPKNRRRPA